MMCYVIIPTNHLEFNLTTRKHDNDYVGIMQEKITYRQIQTHHERHIYRVVIIARNIAVSYVWSINNE